MLFSAEFVALDNNIVNSHYAEKPPEDRSAAEFALNVFILGIEIAEDNRS